MKINVNEIKEFLGCDDRFLTSLMGKFIEESGDGLSKLITASANKNWPVVKATAHKMLSSTRIFNFTYLSEIIEEIETMAEKQTDTDQIPGKVKAVENEWKDIVKEINQLLERSKT